MVFLFEIFVSGCDNKTVIITFSAYGKLAIVCICEIQIPDIATMMTGYHVVSRGWQQKSFYEGIWIVQVPVIVDAKVGKWVLLVVISKGI